MVKSLHILSVFALLAIACGAGAVATGQPLPSPTTPLQATSTAPVDSGEACPLTIPPQPGLIPPEPYPPEPPALYQAVWYGTSALWTMLDPEGEVWSGLPVDDGMFGDKRIWWSDGASRTLPPIIVTGRQLDGSASFEAEAGSPGNYSFREDIGSFMMVGIEIPAAGCWELTARYGDAELSYVVMVVG
ncbi:MAG: hypothetical protein ACRDWA_05020 [Acidimicrobiia bacterium]